MRPGVGPDEETVMSVMGASLDDQILKDVNGLFEQMAELHPAADVWYLPLIGVDVAAQGRGLGSALLRRAAATCDNDGVPAYLEATSPRATETSMRGTDSMSLMSCRPEHRHRCGRCSESQRPRTRRHSCFSPSRRAHAIELRVPSRRMRRSGLIA
jgi:N-acetylglutamate synthase-like GNAT family acetyltransferase